MSTPIDPLFPGEGIPHKSTGIVELMDLAEEADEARCRF